MSNNDIVGFVHYRQSARQFIKENKWTMWSKYLFGFIGFSLLLLVLSGCNTDSNPPIVRPDRPDAESEIIDRIVEQTLNPSGHAPLSAYLHFTTTEEVTITVRVSGMNGSDSDIFKVYDELRTDFQIPIVGLYPDHNNLVEVQFFNANGTNIGSQQFTFSTPRLINDLPNVRIEAVDHSRIKPGFNLVNHFGHAGKPFPQEAFMFDAYGDIRWYLDFTDHIDLDNLFFDNGMIPLRNGNLCFGDVASAAIYEVDLLGNILNKWPLGDKWGFHHAVYEKPNGNILATVTNNFLDTVEDFIIEIDRTTGAVIKEWDLRKPLDINRRTWDTDLANLDIDWMHTNGIDFDAESDAIIVSGRTQGTFKITENNNLQWILAPHKDWNTGGNGSDLKPFLLQPLDQNGDPITDPLVLDGTKNHPDFEWPWYQHSPVLLPNGNILLFDNGDNRNYSFTPFNSSTAYSRAVEYKIDDQAKTIQQVWTYGKERGIETFSRIVSKVDYFIGEDNVLFCPGAVVSNFNNGKVIEVDRSSGDVVFEARINSPNTNFNITFHSVYRMEL